MNSNTKRGLVLATIVALALLVAIWAITNTPSPATFPLNVRRERMIPPHPADIELFYTVKTVISTINVALLMFLLSTYIDIYRKIKSEFAIALMIFSMILLLHALSSNPLLYGAFGFRAIGLGPFAMLPDLFTCIAITILVYLSFKY
ncbi:hypothetical protein KEJ26_02575 [Candidatus Bathyarchaeota archaeon]|nr:hypothetical protein [Candidatus Bathyarchaeota archaeon]